MLTLRPATPADVPALRAMIELSVRALSTHSPAQTEGSVGSVLGLDTQLIQDGTYFLLETPSGEIVASGGWSHRRTLCGADDAPGRDPLPLNPAQDPAKIRAIFVHPAWARQGLGARILAHCESQAAAAGFRSFEMGSTLAGVPAYLRRGYHEQHRFTIPLTNGEALPVVHMLKSL